VVFIQLSDLRGVSKLQNNKSHELTGREKEEVKNLLVTSAVRVVAAVESDNNTVAEEESGNNRNVRNLRTALKKRKAEEPETFIDGDFILATAVELERLWSLAKNLLTDKRRGMATVMIQVILFLKENRNLWNDSMVYQSINNCQQKNTNRRRREREEQFSKQQNMMQATAEANRLPDPNSQSFILQHLAIIG